MTNWKQFWLGLAVVVAVLVIAGPIGYFVNEQAKINRQAEIQKAQIDRDAAIKQAEINREAAVAQQRIQQEEETKRTKERWEWTQRIPGFKGDGQKAE